MTKKRVLNICAFIVGVTSVALFFSLSSTLGVYFLDVAVSILIGFPVGLLLTSSKKRLKGGQPNCADPITTEIERQRIRGYYQPLVSVAEDAFPLHYKSPYTPLRSKVLSDEGQSLMDAFYSVASVGRITLFTEHQDVVPYTLPVEPMQYAVSVDDEHEQVMVEEDAESGKVIGETVLPNYDPLLITEVWL